MSPAPSCSVRTCLFFFTDPTTSEIYTLSLHDALPIFLDEPRMDEGVGGHGVTSRGRRSRVSGAVRCFHVTGNRPRSEEHTSELQSHVNLVCRLLLEKKKATNIMSSSRNSKPFCSLSPF